jgi:hypothetical protein
MAFQIRLLQHAPKRFMCRWTVDLEGNAIGIFGTYIFPEKEVPDK